MLIIIGFIGAGKVGVSLGMYFSSRGIKITGYFSRSEVSSREASLYTGSKNYLALDMLLKDSKIIYITAPDDEIEGVANALSIYDLSDKIICHASGCLSSEVLYKLREKGGYIYSIHPLYPFSNKYTSYKGLENAYFCLEGEDLYLDFLRSILEDLGNKVILIPKGSKPLYHLACTSVSNLVLSIIDIGCSYMEGCGISKEVALSALMPLIDHNIANIRENGINAAITGPIERGDLKTITSHLEIIPREHISAYKAMSLNLLRLSKIKNPSRDYKKIEKCFIEEDF